MTKDGEMEKSFGSYVARPQSGEPRAKLETRAERFTPGPWRVVERKTFFGIFPTARYGWFVADINWFPGGNGPDKGAARANAHLMAASPEMHEALAMVRDADDDCKRDGLPTIPPMARAKIDAALLKAQGAAHE